MTLSHIASGDHHNLEALLSHQPVDGTRHPAVEQVQSSCPPQHVQALDVSYLRLQISFLSYFVLVNSSYKLQGEANLKFAFFVIGRELFHGYCWLEDLCLFPPMPDTPSGSAFVNDFSSFRVAMEHLLGRVLLFYCKINAALNCFICMCVLCDNIFGCICRPQILCDTSTCTSSVVQEGAPEVYAKVQCALMSLTHKLWLTPWNLQSLKYIWLFPHLA